VKLPGRPSPLFGPGSGNSHAHSPSLPQVGDRRGCRGGVVAFEPQRGERPGRPTVARAFGRVGDQQPAAESQKAGAALRSRRRSCEGPGRHDGEGLAQFGPMSGDLGSRPKYDHAFPPPLRRRHSSQEGRSSAVAVEQRPRPLMIDRSQHQSGHAAAGSEVEAGSRFGRGEQLDEGECVGEVCGHGAGAEKAEGPGFCQGPRDLRLPVLRVRQETRPPGGGAPRPPRRSTRHRWCSSCRG
jgi:hypothetical protein